MRTVKYGVIAGMVVIAMLAVNVQGAFLVEPHSSGLANGNFVYTNGTAVSASIPSQAVGLTATNSVFGGNGTNDIYTFSYTPGLGTDSDNRDTAAIPAGTDLGNGDLATGIVGGESGLYNVYITWPPTAGSNAAGCRITITSDGADIVLDPVDGNTGGTGNPGASNAWYKIADGIALTSGVTYTVTQAANVSSYVSQRNGGVLWEAKEIFTSPVTISKTEIDVLEGDTWDSYTVVLDQQPTSDFVYVNMAPIPSEPNNIYFVVGPGDNRVLGPVTLTFTPNDWDLPQTVRIEAVDDDMVESDHYVTIRHTTEPNNVNPLDPPDPAFDGGFAGYVRVNITDNEVPDIRLTETGLTAVSEQGLTDTYDMVLLFPPTGDVTITISADVETAVDVGAGPVAVAQLIFTQTDWWNPQTVTISAIDDEYLEYVHSGTVTHLVTSVDPGYNNFSVGPVVASIEDNECKAWGIAFMDFNKDCVIDIADFAEFAAVWLECTHPQGTNCVDLR